MAGRKLPALPSLAEFPAQDDLIYGVDTSDTSESPDGTSKQIDFGEIAQMGKVTITPVVTAGTGSVNDFVGTMTRIGNNVIFNFFCRDFEIANGEATTSVTLDLTGTGFEPTSNFTTAFQVYGNALAFSLNTGSDTVQDSVLATVASSKNLQIDVSLTANATDYTTGLGGSASWEIVPT